MSKNCLSFLLDSFLFLSECVAEGYSKYQDSEITSELEKYRNFVLENIENIQNEIKHTHDKLNISIESFNELPTEDV